MIGSTVREVAEDSRESQVVGTQRVDALGNLGEQCFAIAAAPGRRALRASDARASEVGATITASAVFGQLVDGVMQFPNVVEDVPPAAEQIVARLAGLSLGFAEWIDGALHASEERQERCLGPREMLRRSSLFS